MNEKSEYAPTVLRLFLGLLFILPGLGKLMNPDMIIGMLQGLGFPAAAALGWLVLLSEIVFGLAILAGWKLQYTVWPLAVIMVVATLAVVLPAVIANPGSMSGLLFHLLALGGLVSLFLSGPGAWAADKE